MHLFYVVTERSLAIQPVNHIHVVFVLLFAEVRNIKYENDRNHNV